jgi:hypothetical protein
MDGHLPPQRDGKKAYRQPVVGFIHADIDRAKRPHFASQFGPHWEGVRHCWTAAVVVDEMSVSALRVHFPCANRKLHHHVRHPSKMVRQTIHHICWIPTEKYAVSYDTQLRTLAPSSGHGQIADGHEARSLRKTKMPSHGRARPASTPQPTGWSNSPARTSPRPSASMPAPHGPSCRRNPGQGSNQDKPDFLEEAKRLIIKLVRSRGLEPPRLAALTPQASASTNSATTARRWTPPVQCRGARTSSKTGCREQAANGTGLVGARSVVPDACTRPRSSAGCLEGCGQPAQGARQPRVGRA